MINIALIGVGYWGPNLLRNLVNNCDCHVSFVAEISRERRKYVKENYPRVNLTADSEQIFSDSKIDAVVIATPAHTHFELTLQALESGKHVLVEKPMAFTVEEVEKLDVFSREKKLVVMVGHTFLYNSAVRYIKKIIDSGDLGEIRYIYSQRVNLGRIRSDVDALWNLAPHDISIIQYWLGDSAPISISRHGMDYIQKNVEDVVFLNILYKNSIMASIHVSWLDPNKIRRMTVVGSKKMVVYDDISENKISVFDKGIDRMAVLGENMDFDNPNTFDFKHRSGEVTVPKINWQEPLKVEVEHFVDCILNGTECITGPKHAKGVVSILESSKGGWN